MKYQILCDYNLEHISAEIANERHQFVLSILVQMGVAFSDEFLNQISDLELFDAAAKEKFREILSKNRIHIIDSHDGDTQILLEENLAARWLKPSYILRQDLEAERSKQLFAEINFECYSVFEEFDEQSDENN